MKVNELTGAALDWAVAKCEGFDLLNIYGHIRMDFCPRYSTDWAQGGPIIEREGLYICLTPLAETPDEKWMATDKYGQITEYGPTPLIAAMRCYVASKLGDEIDLPKELT